MRIKYPLRAVAATLLAGALAVAGAVLSANAQDTDATPPIANINPATLGSITIHKFEQPENPGEPTYGGEVTLPAGLKPVQGVTFKIERVTSIDLTTYAGWTQLATATPDSVAGSLAPVTDGELSTAADGTVTFESLPVGVYLVTETDVTGAMVDGEPVTITNPAPAFLITVPAPVEVAGASQWLYDVHAYPKNGFATLEKTVQDTNATKIGDIVGWTIGATVPRLPGGATFTKFEIVDTFDARLAYVADSAVVTAGGTLLTLTADYTLTATATGLTVTLVDPAAHQGKRVEVKFNTTVVSIGDGTIVNNVQLFINNATPLSDQAETKFGELKAIKYGATATTSPGATTNVLAGAKFDIYNVDPSTAGATPIVTGITTGADGVIHHAGLKVDTATGEKVYWLVETEAPAGYTLPATLAERTTQITVKVGPAPAQVGTYIKNAQQPPFALPLTGGVGTLMFTLGGLVLLALATGLFLRGRGKVNADA